MKKSKKILSVLLALVMLLTSVSVMTVMAEEAKHEHAYVVSKTVEPTCLTKGYTEYKCVCDDVKRVYTDALGHNLIGDYIKIEDGHARYCNRCKIQFPETHNWEDVEVTTKPTCTQAGKKTVKCKDCGYELKNVEVAATGHAITSVAENDITNGTHKGVCTACKKTVTVAHPWGEGVVTKAPKCLTTGELTYTCTVCKKAIKVDTKANVKDIVVLSDKVNEDWAKIMPTHSYSDWKSVDSNNHKRECACGATKTESHNFLVVEGKKSECDNTVALTITCEDCDYKSETKATQHEFNKAEKQDANNHKQTCKKCSVVVISSHRWEDVKVTKEATCKEAGSKDVKCKDCGETKTVAIPKIKEHKWDAGTVTTEATCIEAGVKTFKCTVCEETKTEEIPTKGSHTYGEWKVQIPATPFSDGKKVRECSACGDKQTETFEYEGTDGKYGDVNGDGNVTAVDARIVLQNVAGIRTLTEKEKKAADVSKDGNISAVDARLILQAVAASV